MYKHWLHRNLKIRNWLLLIAIISIAVISCKHNDNIKKQTELNPEKIKKPLENVNKYLVKSEDEVIDGFIKRHDWHMSKTGTGLRYMIYKSGNGKVAAIGNKVKINYEVRLINGDIVYSSKNNGPKEFVIGKSTAEPGLEEGIMLMKVGDRAKLILPSHLAYGLHGDENKVPKRATLIYDVELISIE